LKSQNHASYQRYGSNWDSRLILGGMVVGLCAALALTGAPCEAFPASHPVAAGIGSSLHSPQLDWAGIENG